MNIRLVILAGALAGTLAGSGIAVAQTSPAGAPVFAHGQRNEGGSARNLLHVRRRLEGMIDQLQKDQHDYAGHRLEAIRSLQEARAQLDAAIQYDATHPRG